MKTLKQYENTQNPNFLKPFDEIEETLYHHISHGYVASRFDTGTIGEKMFSQAGECHSELDGVRYYETVAHFNNKFYYLGNMPAFKKPKISDY